MSAGARAAHCQLGGRPEPCDGILTSASSWPSLASKVPLASKAATLAWDRAAAFCAGAAAGGEAGRAASSPPAACSPLRLGR